MRLNSAGDAGTPAWCSAHAGALRRCGHFRYIDQFNIEDEIGFCRDSGMVRTAVGDGADSVGELPGDEEATLATDLHAAKTLIKTGDEAAHALRKLHGLRRPYFWFAIFAEDGFAVLVFLGLAGMVVRGVELDAVGGAVAGVLNLVQLAGLGIGAGSEFDVLVTQGEGGFDDAADRGHAGRQLDAGGRGCGGRLGCGCCRLGGGSGFGGGLRACSGSG